LNIGKGTAYPLGYKTVVPSTNNIPFSKARDTLAIVNSSIGTFNAPGGSVITTNSAPFNLNGLSLSVTSGSGNPHVVTFTGTAMSAADVVSAINTTVNAYTNGGAAPIMKCSYGDNGQVEIQCADGNALTINPVTSDCYGVLGISTGTYQPGGQRIYPTNDGPIKDTSNLNYEALVVEEVTHSSTLIDTLSNTGVVSLLGASNSAADAHDGHYMWFVNEDFQRVGDTVSWQNMAGNGVTPPPSSGEAYYVAYLYQRTATKGVRKLIRVTDAQVTRGANPGTPDYLTFTNATIALAFDGSPVTGLTGNPADVIDIVAVNSSPGQGITSYYTGWTFSKNSTSLAHFPSQINWASAGPQNSGASGQPNINTPYYVTFDMWWHSVEGDYVTADSYVNVSSGRTECCFEL
jgi:hypothetical protein